MLLYKMQKVKKKDKYKKIDGRPSQISENVGITSYA